LLGLVGLAEPERRLRQYPHELSGGMQQRVVLAMALACRPRLLVADEPTTALDATTQVQILDLLRRLQEQERMAVLLITHNFGVVAALARRAYVMYAGRVVEAGPVARLLARPAHPYTRGLIEAVPRLTGARTRLTGIPGAAPEPAARPAGCAFHPRCRWAQAACREREPALERTGEEHEVRCHFWKLIA
jgi:oligopeptide/dipeptide ABC transporter ATP-binding protein